MQHQNLQPASGQRPLAHASMMSGHDMSGMRMLLVEDEYLNALYLADILEDMGVVVLGPVATVQDALELIRDAPEIDAALLDINLDGEPVYPVADALMQRQVPFAFASGYDPGLVPERFRDVDVCLKPIDPGAVEAAMARLRPDT